MGAKKLLRASVIVWGASTAVAAGVLTTGNVLARNQYGSLLNSVFGGKRAIVAEGDNGIDFGQEFKTKEEAYKNGNEVTEEICKEGMILLKNENNALPLTKANPQVSVFGKNSVNLVYGGSGSAAPDKNGERKTIFQSLEAAGISYNPKLKEFYEDNAASGEGRSENPDMENSGVGSLKTGETEISKYSGDIVSSYDSYGDAALVVISRIAGENWDLPRTSEDGAAHYLELDKNERDLLNHIINSNKFQHIIVLLNGSNYIDLGFLKMTDNPQYNSKIDACINIGSPGASGIMALGQILTGVVNPSGHTVDTIYTNYDKDPVWANFGGNFTRGGDSYIDASTGKPTPYYFVEYEENIYMGYRYYETRGHVEGEEWYNKNVVYPFGYGLSYTTFEQSIVDVSSVEGALDPTKPFKVEVKVKNTGDRAGKQVVQLYVTAPYTDGKIEKAYKVLCGFAKTDEIPSKGEGKVSITVDPYYFASFDSKDANGNGFSGFELDGGDYTFHVATDAHTDSATFTKHLDAGYKFEKDPVTKTKVEPLFNEVTEHMTESLSRTNFANTLPKTTTNEERAVSSDFIKTLKKKETNNPETFDSVPKTNEDITVKFKELIGLEYEDEKWDSFLDQMTVEEQLKLFNEGCYSTADIERLGIPKTSSADGPTGLVTFLGNVLPGALPEVYGGCYYCSECLVAQTYNVKLAEKQASAIGNEALVGNERGDKLSYPGWYAPGVNLHRSPFSGRNTEYYSEDPFLAGRMAGTVIKGVQAKGVYANVKHFALNDQETHRSTNGIATWCDEQAMRELYLRPFEMAVKEGETHGLMTSFNRIGTEWAGGSYRLVTQILRHEWGFKGSVICDFHTSAYMDSKQMLYAGGDLNLVSVDDLKLITSGKYGTAFLSTTDPKDMQLLRRSSHNNLYALVNSNAMKADILGYKDPVWQVALTGSTIGIGAAFAVWGGLAIGFALRKKP